MLPLTDLFTLFISGGPVGMIIITLLFIALFFVAWKAPARGTGYRLLRHLRGRFLILL